MSETPGPTGDRDDILREIRKIRETARAYKSQSRAFQVGNELLVRMRKPPQPVKKSRLTRITYKVIYRASELIVRVQEFFDQA